MTDGQGGKAGARQARRDRLAEALRANLRRRKAADHAGGSADAALETAAPSDTPVDGDAADVPVPGGGAAP